MGPRDGIQYVSLDSDAGSPAPFTLVQHATTFWQQICMVERDFPVEVSGLGA